MICSYQARNIKLILIKEKLKQIKTLEINLVAKQFKLPSTTIRASFTFIIYSNKRNPKQLIDILQKAKSIHELG